MKSFQDMKGLELQEVKNSVDFSVKKEKLITDESHLTPGRDAIIREDTGQLLGTVGKKKPIIEYSDIVEWLTSEFDETGIDYKIRENLITNKGDLYQEYVFDRDVTAPDGNNISAMVIVRGSYTGLPLQVQFGTFRFVCSNGVVTGNTIERIKVDGRSGLDILNSSIKDMIHTKFDQFKTVALKYEELEDTVNTVFTLKTFLESAVIPMLMKKNVMYLLRDMGDINLTVKKLKSENLTGAIDSLFEVVNEINDWYLYNTMTQYATHQINSLSGRQLNYKAISDFFGI